MEERGTMSMAMRNLQLHSIAGPSANATHMVQAKKEIAKQLEQEGEIVMGSGYYYNCPLTFEKWWNSTWMHQKSY